MHNGLVCGGKKYIRCVHDGKEGELLSSAPEGSFHLVSMVTASRRI